MIPYCTGDDHTGDAQQPYTVYHFYTTARSPEVIRYTAQFRGYRNVGLDLQQIQSLFRTPSKVAIWGGSAGGIGADCNLWRFPPLWPGTPMYEFNLNGAPLDPRYAPDVPRVGRSWGVWDWGDGGPRDEGLIQQKTCPIEIPAASQTATGPPVPQPFNPSFIMLFNKQKFPDVRKAFSDDYSDSAIDFIACQLGASADANGSCARAVSKSLDDAFVTAINGDENYKVYYHDGTCHDREADGMRESARINVGTQPEIVSECDFDTMRQYTGVNRQPISFHDWVNAFMENSSPVTWDNVMRTRLPTQ
jgi:hypothetical protein